MRAKSLMVLGTASDVGKSVLCTAFCRIFAQEGWRVAPFKGQNMSLNAYVTWDGKEMGHAQGIQAEAAGVVARAEMNPILLKPTGEQESQVILLGRPHGNWSARRYREEMYEEASRVVRESLRTLREESDLVIMEGAGSPVEINLKARDLVNLQVAAWADAPVLLVADIDRGGVFAALVGTLALMSTEERQRVKGVIINRFRGDLSLLQPGLEWFESYSGIPVLGVVPYLREIGIEAEDGVVLEKSVGRSRLSGSRGEVLDMAVLQFPRIANFTDFAPLAAESDVSLRYVQKVADLGSPDVLILPGSKNTVADLLYLWESGWASTIQEFAAGGGWVVGLCGGYQVLGERVYDPLRVESQNSEEMAGLSLLPVRTRFTPAKQTRRVEARITSNHPIWQGLHGGRVSGYEIHMGESEVAPGYDFCQVECESGRPVTPRLDGAVADSGRIWGTYLHGIFHQDDFRAKWLNLLRQEKGWNALSERNRYSDLKEAAFDRLADEVRRTVQMERVYQLLQK